MADNTTQGLLGQLGLSLDPYQQADMVRKARVQNLPAGNGAFASAFGAGQQLGAIGAPGLQSLAGGLAGGVGGLISGDGGRGFKEFGRDFKQGARDMRTSAAAQELGVTPDTLESRARTQRAVSSMQVPNTGDPIKDQIASLGKIAQIANANGDSETAAKAMAKRQQLLNQQQEFAKGGLDNEQAAEDLAEDIESNSMGRPVFMPEDDTEGASSTGKMNDDGTWTVYRPDGTVLESVPAGTVRPAEHAGLKAPAARQWESDDARMLTALKMNGFNPTTVKKERENFGAFAETAEIVNDMTTGLLNMYNPALALSDSAGAANVTDRAFSFVETLSSVFSSPSTKKSDGYKVRYNGKAVTAKKQQAEATKSDHYSRYLADNGMTLRAVLPEHIQEDSEEAQLFVANMMQLAYLDARLQEPSNRGLSDSDIQNALKRIGAGSPNPEVFARRWQTNIGRLSGRLDNLKAGTELAPSEHKSIEEIADHLYSPANVARVEEALLESQTSLGKFLGAPEPEKELTLDEKKAKLAELKAQQAAAQGE